MIRPVSIRVAGVFLLLAGSLLLPAGAQVGNGMSPQQAPRDIVALSEILASARRYFDGKVIEVELELDFDLEGRDGTGRWVYELEILMVDGRLIELEFDALTGRLLEVEGAPWPQDAPRPSP